MDPSVERVSGAKGENSGDGNNLQVVPYSDNKMMDPSEERVSGEKGKNNGAGGNHLLVSYSSDNQNMDPSEERDSKGHHNDGGANNLQLLPNSENNNEMVTGQGEKSGGGSQLVPYPDNYNNETLIEQGCNNGNSGEGDGNKGDEGDGSNLEVVVPFSATKKVVPSSSTKRVCLHCKREFSCGRALGGHMKVHTKGRKKFQFTRTKMSKWRVSRPSSSAPPKRSTKASGADHHRKTTDSSKSLLRWKVQKKRGSNEEKNKTVAAPDDSSSDDDYIECHQDDSCDEDDYDNIRLRKKLRRFGFNGTAHKICWTRRVMMCKVCNQFFKTFVGVFQHVDEKDPTSDTEQENAGEGPSTRGVGEVDAAMGDNNAGSGEVSEKSGGGKVENLDLNKMPPAED
ncbi:uncharacterized protein LOC109809633 [Cajanus cajan]|uniref:uncharacterized protein LOC109809633 n=1 Tax=Cajanus cajan TaxID=3821 RepID=UPI00098D89F5|nr:uncharacterized protein LOC109809633 [Cajanus cajan]